MARFQTLRNSFWTLGAALLVLCVVGCGPKDAASLSGTVTFDGQPIPEGTIHLTATGGIESQGGAGPIVDGAYEIPMVNGLVAGHYQVKVVATRPATDAEIAAMKAADPDGDDEEDEPDTPDEDGEGGGDEGNQESAATTGPKKQYIPKQYNQTSTLTVDLTAGENTQNFDLEP